MNITKKAIIMTDYFISDLHLGHSSILKFSTDSKLRKAIRKALSKIGINIKPNMLRNFSTIEEHNEFIVSKINSVVKKNDKLYILGDVVFGSDNFKYLERLNGIKYLVAGNHDKNATISYLKYFNKVYGQIEYKSEYVLSHIPVHTKQLEHRFKYNLHGHTHANALKDPRYICVSCEQLNYIPISLEEIEERVAKIDFLDIAIGKFRDFIGV